MVLFTGCIDNNYDLSDIDTTSEFKVNDLVIPLNLEPVVLSDIIKVEEGDQLKEFTVNGQTFYAVEQSGEFNSDAIDVAGFNAEPDPMYDKTATFTPTRGGASKIARRHAEGTGLEIFYLLEPVEEALEYEAYDIDGSVKALTFIEFDALAFTIDLSTTSLSSDLTTTLQDVSLLIPAGLEVTKVVAGGMDYDSSSYDIETGVLTLGSVALVDNKTSIVVTASGINLAHYDDPFKYDPRFRLRKLYTHLPVLYRRLQAQDRRPG